MGELAIGIENKPPLDHHVDASDSGKGDLNLESKAGLPHDSLQPRQQGLARAKALRALGVRTPKP